MSSPSTELTRRMTIYEQLNQISRWGDSFNRGDSPNTGSSTIVEGDVRLENKAGYISCDQVEPSRSDQETNKPIDKTQRRLEQNREAARKSRLRKKAYVQQLESSRLKLAQLEQELERTRQQGIYISSPSDTGYFGLSGTVNSARKLTGPRVWPLVGSLPLLFMNRRRIHDWIANNLRATGGSATYQTCTIALPFLALKQGFYTVTCHPKNIEHILRTRFDNYPKGPHWQAAFHDLLGQGIFNSDGETWLIQRKTAALEFTTRTLKQAMARWVNRSIKNRLWCILDKAANEKESVDLQDLLLRLTFDNICGLTFGKDPQTLSPDLPENTFAIAFDAATETTLYRLLYPGFLWRLEKFLGIGAEKRLKSSLQIVEDYMNGAIEARKQTPSDDLLSRFMKKRDVKGNLFTSDVLQRIALNFVLAGRDTSSVALSWFFWLIMNHPEIEQKIINEISTVLRDTRGPDPKKWVEEPLAFDEADRLIYLKAALAETLRLYPSVPQDFKYVVEDDVLPDGTFVPAFSTVTYSIYSVGRMKTIWGEACMEFRPERWLSPEGDKFDPPKDSYKFVAFNAGPRTCLGKDLAYLQMKSVASAVLLRYRLSLVPGHKVEQKMSLTLFMKNGLRVYLQPRTLA